MATAESTEALLAAAREEGRVEAMHELLALIDLTREIFGKIVEIRNDCDPSHPEDVWTAVVVEIDYSPDSHRFEKELEWYRWRNQFPLLHSVRLYVRPRLCERSTS